MLQRVLMLWKDHKLQKGRLLPVATGYHQIEKPENAILHQMQAPNQCPSHETKRARAGHRADHALSQRTVTRCRATSSDVKNCDIGLENPVQDCGWSGHCASREDPKSL